MNPLFSIAAAVVLGIAAVFLASPQENSAQSGPDASTVMLAAELALLPESLAAAGITTTAGVNAVLTNLHEAVTLRETYQDAKAALDQAGQTVTELTELVLIDAGNSTLVAEHAAAVSALATARQTLNTAREYLFDAAIDGLSTQTAAMLHTWRVSAHRSVPPQYKVVQRTEEQWKAIESALRAQQRAAHLGTQLSTAHAQVLSEIAGDTDVITAANNLTTYLGSVEGHFAQHSVQ